MDVEHIPVMEQQIVSLVPLLGHQQAGELLDTIRYLTREGYTLRYALYCEADSQEELLEEGMDEEDRASVCRGWRFVQYFKDRYLPDFLLGWDVGRAAMLARWGCYLGWITEGEAVGVLWELSQKAARGLHSWREFAESYLFGGLMWKLLCGDCAAESYLGFLADAAVDLLTGDRTKGASGGVPIFARKSVPPTRPRRASERTPMKHWRPSSFSHIQFTGNRQSCGDERRLSSPSGVSTSRR
ncbi:MAG: DUF1266 domain-containing protein [Anaerotruncus massiliensis (ex Togo et al. 2019)]